MDRDSRSQKSPDDWKRVLAGIGAGAVVAFFLV